MTRAERRYRRMDHINRKKRILRKKRADNPPHFVNDKDFVDYRKLFPVCDWKYGFCIPPIYHNFVGGMNKGKIHCSCSACSPKTKTKNRRNNYKISDRKKIDSMREQVISLL